MPNDLREIIQDLTALEGILDPGKKSGESISLVSFLASGRAAKDGLTAHTADAEQLNLGMTVEMEHTDDPRIAQKLALDHLALTKEMPFGYYSGLAVMLKLLAAGVSPETWDPRNRKAEPAGTLDPPVTPAEPPPPPVMEALPPVEAVSPPSPAAAVETSEDPGPSNPFESTYVATPISTGPKFNA